MTYLRTNRLSGTLGEHLSLDLTLLELGGCQLSGSLPQRLTSMRSMCIASLYENSLSGSLPLVILNNISGTTPKLALGINRIIIRLLAKPHDTHSLATSLRASESPQWDHSSKSSIPQLFRVFRGVQVSILRYTPK